MADPELVPPDELYAPPGSFMAGERFLDPGQPAAAQKPAKTAAELGAQTDASLGLPPGLQQDLAQQKRLQVDERARTDAAVTGQIDEDRQRYVQAYNAEGIGPNDLKPFNVAETERQTRHSPVEAFGSLGSVFAMVASAFTHQPMTNSLNAGAAALNAIKKGDDQEFERYYNEWKDNTQLALKRQAIQHEQYTDSISLASTDLRSADAKFKMQATRFGDQEALLMQERYGLASKETVDFINHRNAAALGTAKATEEIIASKGAILKEEAFQRDQGSKSQDPNVQMQTWKHYFGTPEPALQQALEAKRQELAAEGKPMGSKDIIDVNHEMQRQAVGGTAIERAAVRAQGDPDSPYYQQPLNNIINGLTKEQTAAKQGMKDFTKAESAMVEAAPSLVKHLRTLDRLADQATGITTGELQKLAAEYGGINDPAAIYQAALKGARDAAATWSGGGQTNKATVEARLDRLPKTYQNAHFNRGVIEGFLQDVTNQTASGVSIIESSGKKTLPPLVRQQLTEAGIYGEHDKGQNPLNQFKENPQSVPDDTLRQLRINMGAYPAADQTAIAAEVKRRKEEWDKAHGR